MDKLTLPLHVGATAITLSAIVLIYGSLLIWKNNFMKGGLINLVAGTLLPIPTYIYFAFFSKPTLLGWFSPLGLILFIPAMISGIIGIYASKI